ncbi:uncharacterized protein C8Q71DRAFT_739742 [Rhodofomes roseus]|uniref:Uncharacterized protein n=1 Tax=Rhodofomes roseus TaxID=34475 RepID=A0ABQ8KT88_9APHY|nr:uncharacterized protein C8Q71DRAFT_739742 [Rhodofomes roseus]KAH9842030.1 hypothetical protein C8Q71DRAFT_739742 [Rhodofomes roseus]
MTWQPDNAGNSIPAGEQPRKTSRKFCLPSDAPGTDASAKSPAHPGSDRDLDAASYLDLMKAREAVKPRGRPNSDVYFPPETAGAACGIPEDTEREQAEPSTTQDHLISVAPTQPKVIGRKWNPRNFRLPLVHPPGVESRHRISVNESGHISAKMPAEAKHPTHLASPSSIIPGISQRVEVPGYPITPVEPRTSASSPPQAEPNEEDVTMGSPNSGPVDNNKSSFSEILHTEADPSSDSDIEVIESPMDKLIHRKPRHHSPPPSPIIISDSEPDRTASSETGLLFDPSPELHPARGTCDDSGQPISDFSEGVQPTLQRVIVSDGQQNWTRLPYLFQEGEHPEDLIPPGAPLAARPEDWDPLVRGGGLVAIPEDITLAGNDSNHVAEHTLEENGIRYLQNDFADRVVSTMESAPMGRMYTSPAEATAPLDPFHNLWTRDSGQPLQWPRNVVGPSYSGRAPTALSELLHQRTILESRIESLEQVRRSNALNIATVGWVLSYYNCAQWPQPPQQ